jgi:peptidyl-prolyl cis-trans isomerase D
MLQAIRERAQGWIAWVIVFLISIPFALWGIQSYLGVGGEPIVAKVEGIEITDRELSQRVQQARMEMRDRLGPAYDPQLFEEGRLRVEVLDDLIRQALLLQVSDRIGMRVSDAEVRAQILVEPAFQRDGRFDRESYDRLLRLQGLSPAAFEGQVRQQLVGNQLARAVASTELVTRDELDSYQRLIGQTRDFAFARVALADDLGELAIPEEDVRAYYDGHVADFQSPEMVKLDYLVLDVAELARDVSVDDADLLRVYEENPSRFGQAEQRSVRHLLVAVPANADEAAIQASAQRIRGIRERLESGEPFDALAKAESEDPGSAALGGSLGTIEKGLMDPAFDDAAFAQQVGQVSEPVRTRFGYHLIEVTEIIPASMKPFDEVKETLRAEVARERAEAIFYDLGERLATLVYESPDSLVPAAESLGLTVQQSDWLGRDGGDGVLASPRVMGAAFSEDVIGGANSDLIEPDREVLQAVVVRVAEHRPAAPQALDEVREQILETLRRTRASEDAKRTAQQAADQLKAGADWAVALPGGSVESPGPVGRDAQDVAAEVVESAFELPVPPPGGASVGVADLSDGSAAVIRLTAVSDGTVTPIDGSLADVPEALMLARMMGQTAYDAMLADMERRAKVERRSVQATSLDP